MKYRSLGKWGLKVSEIALGSWMTDVQTPEAVDTAKKSVRRAYDLGVNFLIAQMPIAADKQKFFSEKY